MTIPPELHTPATRPTPATGKLLTVRELQVLTGMSYGHSNRAIGRALYLAEDTIKTHARRLMRKLGVVDRAHAVRVGLEMGLLTAYQPTTEPPRTGHPTAVPGHTIPTPGLTHATARDRRYRDEHIAACAAAEACPCRRVHEPVEVSA